MSLKVNGSSGRMGIGFTEVLDAFAKASEIVGCESGLDAEQLFLAKSSVARMVLERADMAAAIENMERQQEIEKLHAVYGGKEQTGGQE